MIGSVLIVYAILVAGLLYAELTEKPVLKYVCKPLAGFGFLTLAILCGALDSHYGQIILAGLAFSFIGDSALLKDGTGRWFAFGVIAFFIAHLLYALAFIHIGDLGVPYWLLPAGFTLMYVVFSIGLLKPPMAKSTGSLQMDNLIYVYSASIVAMAGMAVFASIQTGLWIIVIAAGLFVISDIFVERNRFGKSSPKQFWIITPFYFAAQAGFALSILQT